MEWQALNLRINRKWSDIWNNFHSIIWVYCMILVAEEMSSSRHIVLMSVVNCGEFYKNETIYDEIDLFVQIFEEFLY